MMSDAGDNNSNHSRPPMPTMAPPPLPPPSPHRSVISQLSSTSTTTSTSSAKDLTHLIAISTEEEEEENHSNQDEENTRNDNNEDTLLEDAKGKKTRRTKKPNCFQFGRSRNTSTRTRSTNLLNFCPTRLIQIGSKQNTLEEYNLTDYDYNDDDDDDDREGNNNHDENATDFVTLVQQGAAEATVAVQGVLEEHVQPTLEQIRRHSSGTLQDVQQHSSRSWAAVQTTTQHTVETLHGEAANLVARTTTQLHHSSQQFHVVSTNVRETTTTLVHTHQVAFTTWSRRCSHAMTVTYHPYYAGTAPGFSASVATTEAAVLSTLFHCIEGTFRAYGTVVFCNNPITGLFIWWGMLVAAPWAGFASILGVLTVRQV